MPEPESGPHWRRLADGAIQYRESRWSQTYTVSEEQLARLKSLKKSEWAMAILTILPAAATVVAWLSDALTRIVPAIAIAAYVGINLAVSSYCSRQRRQVLAQARPSSRELLFPSMATVHSDLLDKLGHRHRLGVLLYLAFLVLAGVTYLAKSLGGFTLGKLGPMHPLLAILSLVIFGPLLYLHARDWLRRRRSETSNGLKDGRQ